jgi:predicted kinase
MATLFPMCGLPGSGETTLARRIERDRDALRLRLTPGILS